MEFVANATASPARAAASESKTHSVSNCCEMRARLAPKAERVEGSAARSAVRAIRRLATLVQAISRTSRTQAISTRDADLVGPASASRSGSMVEIWVEVLLGPGQPR